MKAKRTIAGVLSLAMLTSAVTSFSAVAAGQSVTLKAAKVTAEAGGTFSVDVSLEDIPSTKVNTLDFAVTYDSAILTVDAVTIGSAAEVSGDDSTAADAPTFSTNVSDGEISVSWTTGLSSESWIAEDGVIFTITGTVASGVEDGTVTPIEFAPITRTLNQTSSEPNADLLVGYIYGTDSEAYTVNAEAGSVTIGSGSVVTEEPKQTTEAPAQTEKPDPTTEGPVETESPAKTTAKEDPTTTAEPKQTTEKVTVGDFPKASLYGDVNCDGGVDITDAVMLNKAAAGAVKLNEMATGNADCDANQEINNTDAITLLRFLVRVIDSLPYSGN